jgi:hypothetical protein
VVAVMSWKAFYAALTAVITAAIACASEFGGLGVGRGVRAGGRRDRVRRLRRDRRARGAKVKTRPARPGEVPEFMTDRAQVHDQLRDHICARLLAAD